MRKSDRPYLVVHRTPENVTPPDPPHHPLFVLARGPKEAVAKVAELLTPNGRLWGFFHVTPLHDTHRLDYLEPKRYEVRLERRVARVYKK